MDDTQRMMQMGGFGFDASRVGACDALKYVSFMCKNKLTAFELFCYWEPVTLFISSL